MKYTIIFYFFFFLTVIHSQNLTQKPEVRRLWDKITHKVIDDRHLYEDTLLFPDVGFQSLENNTIWTLMIHGWRYRGTHKKQWLEISANLWLKRLAENLVNENDILYLNGSINRDRLQPFFVTDEVNEDIFIRIGNHTRIFQTDHYGEFYDKIQLTNDALEQHKNRSMITYEAIGDDDKIFNGMIKLIEPSEGLSVISDIDDTIKISEVLDKVRLLTNTFVFPYKPVPGMPELYQQWKIKYPTCTFHYLSGMPDQLYTLTQEFINTNHFPDGTFHMRHFGWAFTSLFNFLHSESTFKHKISYLRFFLSNTKRDYILIGDSGEKDPEIYGIITREYPQRIRAIFIRAIKGESFDDQRFESAFEGLSKNKWMIFNDPEQVPIDLSKEPRNITHI